MATRYRNRLHLDLRVGLDSGGHVVLDAEVTADEDLSGEDLQEGVKEAIRLMLDGNYKRSPGMFVAALSEVRPDWEVAMTRAWNVKSDGETAAAMPTSI